jgi:uncharacterized protein with HEPN domain
MPRDARTYLADIRGACDHRVRFTDGRTFEDFTADILLRSAVERQFEIVGEALRVTLREAPDLATRITDAAAIIAFRNQLAHVYSAVDHKTVWGILQCRVPMLRREIDAILATWP